MNANGEIMSIEYGKSGFRRSKLSTENRQANREIVNSYNEKHGITAEQVKTMKEHLKKLKEQGINSLNDE